LRLGQRLRRNEAEVTLVDPYSHLTYQPLLADAAAGDVEPRHVAVPLRRILHGTRVITAELVHLSHASRRAVARLSSGEHCEIGYDWVVLAPGSVARTLPIPGLAEIGVGFKNLGEAVYLRNRILERLDFAASTADRRARQRALTFVVVGGGYAGIEALGELSDMTAAVLPVFSVDPAEVHWVLVELENRILPEVSLELGSYTVDVLRRRHIDVRLSTKLVSCVDGRVELDPGEPFEADTLIWTAGVRANPVLAETDLPLDDQGRLVADAFLRVRGTPDAWTAGDCAAVPDLTSDEPGALCAPTAQHAVRQARRLADNLVALLRNRPPLPYRHRYVGSVASLGRFQGVAQIYGRQMCGWPAWLLHRGYHLLRLPSAGRRTRVFTDWLIAAVFPRDIVSLGEIHQPRELFIRTLAERERARIGR
jgi:NADH:ubiquinone reductase (H+-translocating)